MTVPSAMYIAPIECCVCIAEPDIFTKAFISKSSWQQALSLINVGRKDDLAKANSDMQDRLNTLRTVVFEKESSLKNRRKANEQELTKKPWWASSKDDAKVKEKAAKGGAIAKFAVIASVLSGKCNVYDCSERQLMAAHALRRESV